MKTGLFLPAPVSLSPYITGAIQALMREGGVQFDVIASSSGAALPAGYAAMDAIEQLVAIWERLENKDWAEVNWAASIKGAGLWAPSLMDNRPVHQTAIDGHILENRLRPGVRWRLHAVRLTTGHEEIWEFPGAHLPLETAVHLAMAVPVLFPAIDYDGTQWVDAATLNGCPLEELILSTGVERVFFVGHAPQSALPSPAGNVLKILMTALEWNQFSETITSIEHANDVSELARAWQADRAAVERALGELIDEAHLRAELLSEVDRVYQAAAFPIARAPVEIIPVLPQQRLAGLFGDFKPARSRESARMGSPRCAASAEAIGAGVVSSRQGFSGQSDSQGIAWPDELTPGQAHVHAHNELLIPAKAEVCFAWLRRAALWPAWYANCGWFKFDTPAGPDLTPDTSFTWHTFHAPVRSTVRRFDPPLHLEWDATTFGIRAYHGWLLIPQDERCLVITEETQTGFVPFFFRWYLPGMLRRGHQTWLEGLRAVTAGGRLPG